LDQSRFGRQIRSRLVMNTASDTATTTIGATIF